MDFKSKGISLVGKICQKFETLCSEVDDIMCQEPFKYVENQLLTASANVKQFCSEIVQDVLPPFLTDSIKEEAPDLSLEQNKNTDLTAHERSNVGVDGDHRGELCNVNSLSHVSFVEPVEELHIDSSFKQNADIGIHENLNVGVKEYPVEEKLFPSEILEVVAPAEEDLSMVSLFVVNQSIEGWDGQVSFSTPISVKFRECNSSMESGETSNLLNAKADNLRALLSVNAVVFAESDELRFPDNGATSYNASSAVLNDTSTVDVTVSITESSWSGFELNDEFAESEDFVSLQDSERSDDASAEEAMDDHITKPGMETTQPFDKLKLDESCIVVDNNELCSISELEVKLQSYEGNIQTSFSSKMKFAKEQACEPQATCSEDTDAELNQPKGESFTPSLPTGELESPDHDIIESEWEVI